MEDDFYSLMKWNKYISIFFKQWQVMIIIGEFAAAVNILEFFKVLERAHFVCFQLKMP